MKKIIMIIGFVAIAAVVSGQTAVENVLGLPEWFAIGDNYQDCDKFHSCNEEYTDRNYFRINIYLGRGDSTEMLVTKMYTDHRLAVRGVAVMRVSNWNDVNPNAHYFYYNNAHVEEEVMIWNRDTLNGQPPDASVSWVSKALENVAVPQCTQTMYDGDDTKFLHFALDKLLFPHSLAVDSFFCIGGTLRNNKRPDGEHSIHDDWFVNCPTLYPYIAERHPDPCATCDYEPGHYVGKNNAGVQWTRVGGTNMWSGPFFLILDTNRYTLTALPDDTARGSVSGSGVYDPLDLATVVATPREGYWFYRWSDGVTDNPRQVEVLSDTTLVAIFRANGDTTGIDDISEFKIQNSKFKVFPNPANDELYIVTDDEGVMQLQLFDASGRTISEFKIQNSKFKIDISHLSAGQYYIKIRGGEGESVQTFVKN